MAESLESSPSTPEVLAAGRSWLLDRLDRGVHPLDGLEPAAARATIESLAGLDPEPWTAAWRALAETCADAARAAGDDTQRRERWLQAYRAAFLGRYPVPSHPLKQALYDASREYFIAATTLEDPPLEVVEIPFAGRAGEGDAVRVLLTGPRGSQRPPVAIVWGGIDTWKEESHARMGALMRSRGCAVVLIDMPGTGESPVLASPDAERQWTPVFDWLESREDLDASRCAVIGASFGGYWAQKLGVTHRERLTCAVNWGGGVHVTFTPEWQERSRDASSYLMDLMIARARIFGGHTFEDYIARCPELSLLEQGILDEPSAPTLLVNGRHDLQNSIDDLYLSLDHGSPKAARVFPGGHMGEGPTAPTIADWACAQLGIG